MPSLDLSVALALPAPQTVQLLAPTLRSSTGLAVSPALQYWLRKASATYLLLVLTLSFHWASLDMISAGYGYGYGYGFVPLGHSW
jgi:hypothetical protein